MLKCLTKVVNLCLTYCNNKFLKNPNEVAFSQVDKVPVYKGCDALLTNRELKRCMGQEIAAHMTQNFNLKMLGKLDLPDGIVNIHVAFKISKRGKVVQVQVKAPHPKLKAEAIRVARSMPLMKPAKYKGKPVVVSYALPLQFMVSSN